MSSAWSRVFGYLAGRGWGQGTFEYSGTQAIGNCIYCCRWTLFFKKQFRHVILLMNKGPGLNKYLMFSRKALLVFCPIREWKNHRLLHEIKRLNEHQILNNPKTMIEMWWWILTLWIPEEHDFSISDTSGSEEKIRVLPIGVESMTFWLSPSVGKDPAAKINVRIVLVDSVPSACPLCLQTWHACKFDPSSILFHDVRRNE